MDSKELRDKFLKFFEERGHTFVSSSSLLPKDPSVLLTTAGMQQFKPYYLEEKSPYGNNAVSCQKCFRTSDIEEVGDERHLTFFEMLGNFSFGGYFKKEAIKSAKEFIDFLGIKIDYVTVFEGDKDAPKDEESAKIWEKLGFSIKKGNLKFCGREENFWGPTGEKGPCGPTTEIYAGGIEIWNIVFNEYYCKKDGKLEKLEKPGIDTGMGLERLAKVIQKKETLFETDLFLPLIKKLEEISGKKYEKNKKEFRIIADHIRGACFLIADGILPGNMKQGYILRRVLRRAIRYGRILDLPNDFLRILSEKVIEEYKNVYPELKRGNIISVIKEEQEKFEKTLALGINSTAAEIAKGDIGGETALRLYSSYGFPIEMIKEMAKEKGRKVDVEGFKKAFKKHQEISRAGAKAEFKGGLADHSEQTIKYHTAAHLLLSALRKVLGPHVQQKGSNLTSERLRFDFSHPQKMTDEEIKETEDLVNQKIKEGLKVEQEEMPLEKAKKQGAMGVFGEKYGERVSVYTIGGFSKEICGGPHVKNTSELGRFKIKKEESSSAGVRRIRAVLE